MKKLKQKYDIAKSKNIGENANCPCCGKQFVKKTKQQAFCGSKENTKCKDKYWNTVTPNKRNNKTRISPASAKYMASSKFGEQFKRRTSEGYVIKDGVAYDKWGHPVYTVDPFDDTHPFDLDGY